MSVTLPGVDDNYEVYVGVEDYAVSDSESVRTVRVDGSALLMPAQALGVAAAIIDQVRDADPGYPIVDDLCSWCLVLELADNGPPLERAGQVVSDRLVAAAVRLREKAEPRWKRRLRGKGKG